MSPMEWLEPAERGLIPDETQTLFEAMGFQRLGCVRTTVLYDGTPRQMLFEIFGATGEATTAKANYAGTFYVLEFVTELDDGRVVVTMAAIGTSSEPPGQVTVHCCEPQSVESLWAVHRSNLERVAAGTARPRTADATREEFVAIQEFRWERRAKFDQAMTVWALILAPAALIVVALLYLGVLELMFAATPRSGLGLGAYTAIGGALAIPLLVAVGFALGGRGTGLLRGWLLRRLPDPRRGTSVSGR
jgi:hypothetical protein